MLRASNENTWCSISLNNKGQENFECIAKNEVWYSTTLKVVSCARLLVWGQQRLAEPKRLLQALYDKTKILEVPSVASNTSSRHYQYNLHFSLLTNIANVIITSSLVQNNSMRYIAGSVQQIPACLLAM